MQHTLQKPVSLQGVGLHTNEDVTINILPAAEGAGIVFVRTDLPPGKNTIPALYDYVVNTKLCTVIGLGPDPKKDAQVGTIEHLMSALRGCDIDNAVIEIDGPEVPIMDGSAQPFVELIEKAGRQTQSVPRSVIRILKEVTFQEGDKFVRLSPAEGSIFGGEIAFAHKAIGHQRYETKLMNGNFMHEIAEARTFGFIEDVEKLRLAGLALGADYSNAIVLDKDAVLNEGPMRFDDEFIRHKLLDAIGDLYLAGHPIQGAYEGFKAGHALNNAILHKLFDDKTSYEIVSGYDGKMVVPALVSAAQPELHV